MGEAYSMQWGQFFFFFWGGGYGRKLEEKKSLTSYEMGSWKDIISRTNKSIQVEKTRPNIYRERGIGKWASRFWCLIRVEVGVGIVRDRESLVLDPCMYVWIWRPKKIHFGTKFHFWFYFNYLVCPEKFNCLLRKWTKNPINMVGFIFFFPLKFVKLSRHTYKKIIWSGRKLVTYPIRDMGGLYSLFGWIFWKGKRWLLIKYVLSLIPSPFLFLLTCSD